MPWVDDSPRASAPRERPKGVPVIASGAPRLLTIMGSGETSPTMTKVHRSLLQRVAPGGGSAVLLDTPYGFQENAADISAKAVDYFAKSVGHPIEVAGYLSADTEDLVAREKALARIRGGAYLFAGPGSPSYTVAQWKGGPVPGLLADKLAGRGCVTFASAAACTMGAFTLPVYEIYKVGMAVHWLDGLNLLAAAGLSAVVVPHYNNAEGGNHDTRFCYMGERRLAEMEKMLPPDVFVLGVDEHTGLILDLEAASATVVGLGVVTVRKGGVSATVATGTTLSIDALASMVGGASPPVRFEAAPPSVDSGRSETNQTPLLAGVAACEGNFNSALAKGASQDAVRSVLELEALLVEWSRDTTQSDHLDRGRAALRSILIRLGEAAEAGLADPRERIAPFVEALLECRRLARSERRFAESDSIRDRLVGAGIEVQDTADGTNWDLC